MSEDFIKDFHKIYEELCNNIDASLNSEEKEIYELSLTCLKNTMEEMKKLEDLNELGPKNVVKIIEKNLI